MLHIQLFGQPVVYKDDQPVIIKRRVTRALLFYIAAMPKPVSRDALLDLFWPEKSFDRARLALADTLSKLRANLNEDQALLMTPGFISINRQVVDVDWLYFCDLMTDINRQPSAFQPSQNLSASQYQKMATLVALWDKRDLMASDDVALSSALDAWLADLRMECNDFLKRVIKRLGQHETQVGNHDQAVNWLLLARGFDEFEDGVNEALVQAFLHADRHAEARTLYMELKEAYQGGVGDSLPAFLRDLEPRLTFVHPTSSPMDHPNWSIKPGLLVPFIGQEAALADLKKYGKRGGGVIVIGDGGSGKTRLVHEFCRQTGAGTRLLVATCQPLEAGMPFAPWVGLLRASIRDADWRNLDQAWAVPLTLLLPELQSLRPELRSLQPGSLDVSRTVMQEAIYQLLLLLAQREMIILFLDDAHWADESSLALVSYLLKKSLFRPGRGLLILSARAEEKTPTLDEFLLAGHQEPLHRIDTQLFSQEDLAALCTFVFSRPVPGQFLEKLYYDTGGNEYFSIQILQAFLEENPEPDFEHVDALPLPPSMSDAMRRKFSALSAPARDVINAAAVLGSQFEIPLLEGAVSLPGHDYLLALEELERARILRSLREDDLVFGFVHEKLRERILFNLNQNRKRLLHRNVAVAMENRMAVNLDAQAALLAYHYEEAGLYPRAFDAWVQAAQYAWRLMAVDEAIKACRRAERLIRRSSELSEIQIYTMYCTWNQITSENDDFKALEMLNLSLKTLGQERNSNLLTGAALTGLSDAEMARNNFEKALAYAEEAIDYIQTTENSYEKARVHQRRGVNLYMLGRLREAQHSFWLCLDLTKDAKDALSLIERGTAFYQLALTETLRGNPLQGLEHAQQSLIAHQQAGNIYGQIAVYSVTSLAYYLMVNYVKGCENALLGIELADRVEGWRMNGYLCGYAGLCEVELGRLDAAWEHAQKAIEIGRRQGHGEIVGMGFRVLGDIYQHLGALSKASDAYQQGLAAAAGQHFVALELMVRFGYVQFLLGQPMGRSYLLQAIHSATQADMDAIAVLGTVQELSMYLLAGEQELFDARAVWLREQVIKRTRRDVAGFYLNRILAEAAFAKGDYQQAYDLAQPCMAWYRGTQNPWFELNMTIVFEQCAQKLGLAQMSLRPRMNELLNKIESSLQSAPLQAEWQDFLQKNTF